MPLSHLLLLLLVCLIWAGNFISASLAVDILEPVTFTTLRFGLVLLILLPLIRLPPPGQWGTLLACCWSMGALHFALVFLALGRSEDVSSVAILMQIYVPMSTLLAVLFLGERLGWPTATGITLAFAGVLVVGLDPLVLAQLDALLLALSSAFFLAVGLIFMRQLKGINLFNFQAWHSLLSIVPLALLAWMLEDPIASIASTESWRNPAWAALAYSVLGASIVGHGAAYWLIQRHGITRITPYMLLVPVLAVLLGVLIWGDRPGPRLLVGGTLVIAGVLWITLRARQRVQPVAEKARVPAV